MNEKPYYFDHERLDVYQAAMKFVTLTNEIIENLPRGRAYLADQFQRASTSILLNIAEGAGELSTNEKVRFYRMARRSATECAGILAVIQNLGLTKMELQQRGRELLLRVVSMLSKMVQVNRNGSENANANVHGAGSENANANANVHGAGSENANANVHGAGSENANANVHGASHAP